MVKTGARIRACGAELPRWWSDGPDDLLTVPRALQLACLAALSDPLVG
jgi:hypothetical protein